MSEDRRFLSWMRQGLGAKGALGADGQMATTLTLSYGGEADRVDLSLWGPGHVAGLQSGFITQQVPAQDSTDATPGSLAWAALSDAYLPWALPFDEDQTPWLALLCIPSDLARIDATAQPGPRLVFKGDASAYLPDAAVLRALSHTETRNGAPVATRLIAPTRLEGGVSYLCAVVPSSARGRAAGMGQDPGTQSGLAWGNGTPPDQLPAYAHWSFRCGTVPSFEDVIAKLTPVSDPGVQLTARTSPDTNDILGLSAPEDVPLRTIFATPGDVPPPSAALSDALLDRLETNADRIEPLGLPAYGRTTRRTASVPWFAQLNGDPSLRLAAGLGARVAADHRDHIADFASAQVGAVDAVNALLARARAAMTAGARRWQDMAALATRRPAEFLGLVAPALRRTAHDGARNPEPFVTRIAATAAAPMTDPATRLALRSDLARRAGGAGGSAWPSVTEAPSLDTVLKAQQRTAARGRVPGGKLIRDPNIGFDGSEQTTPVPSKDPLAEMEALRDNAAPAMERPSDDLTSSRAEIEATRAKDQFATGRRAVLQDTVDLATDVHAALDPKRTGPRRTAARVKLHPEMGELPVDLSQIKWEPPWPVPLVDLLARISPDLVAPAAGRMKPHDVLLLEADQTMMAAVLVGANHAALADLRWRNFPVRPDMSPVRRVFPRVRIAGTAHDAFDAPPIRSWHTTLGANLNGSQETARPPRSVLLIRSPLFEMYPETVLYAARAVDKGGTLAPSSSDSRRSFPTAFGFLQQGLAYVGFSIDPDDLAGRTGDGWFLVFQGPDEAGGFSLPATGPAPSWATMDGPILTSTGLGAPVTDPSATAQLLLDRPLTVALHAARLMKDPTP